MRELGTGSEMQRVVACPGSAVLPRVDVESDAAAHGQVVHEFLAAVPTAGREAALEAAPLEHRTALEGIPVASLPLDATRFRAEVAYAYDLNSEKARVLGQHLHRRYKTEPHEVPITLDVAGVAGERAMVADYKSGWGHVPPAAENLQIGLGVLVVADVEGLQEGRGAIIRVRDSGEPFYDEAEFGGFELEEVRDRLRQARAAVREQRARYDAGKAVDVTMGRHCRYCPAQAWCPGYQRMIAGWATRPDDQALELASEVTPQLAAQAYRNFRAAKQHFARAEEILRAWAAEHLIDLGDGWVYGPRSITKTSLDGEKTHAILERLHGREIADAGVSFEASKASVQRALAIIRERSAGKRPAVAAMLREVLAELERTDGITTTSAVRVEEHKPQPAEQLVGRPEETSACGRPL